MITYPRAGYFQQLIDGMRANAKKLPLYRKGPAVDYTEADHAYAIEVTLLWDPQRSPQKVYTNGPGNQTEILLVERASGHGQIGHFGGVTGYIDTFTGDDPIVYTLRNELATECNLTEQDLGQIQFYAGQPTEENRTFRPGAKITVVPVLGLCQRKQVIRVNPEELKSYCWVPLPEAKERRLKANYLEVTLPSVLRAIPLNDEAIAALLT